MSAPEGLLAGLLGAPTAGEAPPAKAAVKALAWARVSTEMQEERGLSIPEQLREIRSYAEAQGIEIVGEFQEAASAFQRDKKRVEFHRMVRHAMDAPEVNAILVHDLSRFSRDSARAKNLMRDLRAKGVRVISLNDPEFDPETVSGVYLEAITLAKNEAYSREVAFHTRKGCRANIRARDPQTGWCYKNGGQPIWGYRTERVTHGEVRRGREVVKAVWVPDETVVAGRPTREWVRHCLVELAGKGASLEDLRDFCNGSHIPARRGRFWSISTWNSLLQPNALLQYCGYGVWNVHRKNGTKRPPDEWVIVPNAQEALVGEEEALHIAASRRTQSERRFDLGYSRSRTSPYLLSGGLFRCGRCGANMMGFKTAGGRYYVCGSQPYRRGMGCGPGVYVPQAQVEAEVIEGLEGLVGLCADPQGFTRQVNQELLRLWETTTGYYRDAERKLREIDSKIANIRRAIEDGLDDARWANERLGELLAERAGIGEANRKVGAAPQIDARAALAYRADLGNVLVHGEMVDRKKLVRAWVQEMKLAPERLEVEITYRLPEPVVNCVVAREGFEPSTSRL